MSGGGGGTIIIRSVMKKALSDPLIHGDLPQKISKVIDPVLSKDEGAWTFAEHHAVIEAFNWVALNCIP